MAKRRGRPRKDGARFPSGKLRQVVDPNPRVLEDRRALAGENGDIRAAGHPLDCALARGWLTEAQHRAGSRYAAIYRAARIAQPESRGGLCEAPEAQTIDKRPLGIMADAEITAAFDRIFNVTEQKDRSATALAQWSAINQFLNAAEQAECFSVCVRSSWPQWIVQRAAGHFQTGWERKREVLISALDQVAQVLGWTQHVAAKVIDGPHPSCQTLP